MLSIIINIIPSSIIHGLSNNGMFVLILYEMRTTLNLKFDYLDFLIVRGLINIDEQDK